MRFLALVVPALILALAVYGVVQLANRPTAGESAPVTFSRASIPPAQPQSQPPVAPQPTVTTVRAAEARSWCIDGPCDLHRFEEFREGPNTIVVMTTGPAVTISIPNGTFVDAWVPSGVNGCDSVSHPVGPATFVACEATFRRSS